MIVAACSVAAISLALVFGLSDRGLPSWLQGADAPDEIAAVENGLTEPVSDSSESVIEAPAEIVQVEELEEVLTESPVIPVESVVVSPETQAVAYEIARGDWPDSEFYAAAAQLKQDPELLQALLVEFQGETDSKRLRRISQLLAETDSPILADAAANMLYSGNDDSKAAGMDLLRRIQQNSPEARDVAIDLLATETDPSQLKSALDIFAKPGVATAEQHSAIINQIAPMASSDSALVRRQSLTVLSRWVDDPSQTPVFRAGLADEDLKVRQAAAFAMVDYAYADDAVKLDLLNMAENDDSNEVRGAALLALGSLSLSEEQVRRYEAAKKGR